MADEINKDTLIPITTGTRDETINTIYDEFLNSQCTMDQITDAINRLQAKGIIFSEKLPDDHPARKSIRSSMQLQEIRKFAIQMAVTTGVVEHNLIKSAKSIEKYILTGEES